MQKVPKNKTIYVGGRRFVAGDALPPHIRLELPDSDPVEKKSEENSDSSKDSKSGKFRKFGS